MSAFLPLLGAIAGISAAYALVRFGRPTQDARQ